jgi:DNA primase
VALIPDEVVGDIRDRIDIVAVIGEHVQLKKAGVNWKGLCPFHQEKTPSFHVNPPRRTFYCFGCQKKGDVFSFLMELGGKSFAEVVRELAGRAGVTIPERPMSPEEQARRSERGRLHDVNATAAAYYRSVLGDGRSGTNGRAYLEGRGIGPEVAAAFQLGLAPDAWDGLVRHLEQRKVPLEPALVVGLVARRSSGSGHYDRFRNRIMCPVILPGGEIAGFSGRTLAKDDPETPKYMNSPENPVYKKSQLLFGLNAARPSFARKGRAVLVEGNFDVVALHQAGFTETVAPLGTALTAEQVETLRRLAPSVVLCLDGDKAGRAAALRAIPLLVAAGVDARVAALPEKEDPDSFVRRHGAAALEELLGRAPSAIDHFLDEIWYRSDRSAEARSAALHEAAPLITAVADEVKRDIVIQQFARALDVETRVVRMALKSGSRTSELGPPAPDPRPEARGPKAEAPPPPAELKLFAILADHPDLLPDAEHLGIRSLLTDARLRDMYSRRLSGQSFLDAAPQDISDHVARAVLSGAYAAVSSPRRTLLDAVRMLRSEQLELELARLHRAAKDANRRGDTTLERELTRKYVETRKHAEDLKRRPEEEPR